MLQALLKSIKACLEVLTVTSEEGEHTTPLHLRWWEAAPRRPLADEARLVCQHCSHLIGQRPVKQCPNCRLVLHAVCYDDTQGGQAYQTPGCDACRHRCYWR